MIVIVWCSLQIVWWTNWGCETKSAILLEWLQGRSAYPMCSLLLLPLPRYPHP